MEKLTDPNPYDVLAISPQADRETIKQAMATRQRENRTVAARQQARDARKTLASTHTRLVVDALTPDFVGETDESSLKGILEELRASADPVDWHEIADPEGIVTQDLQALIEATIRHTLGNVPVPKGRIELVTAFDGLDDFLEAWLR